MPLVSVIAAIYNVERYVEDCIKSIAGQTFGDMEILLIDDGSQLSLIHILHYKPLPMLTAYKNLGFCMEAFPHAYAQFENEITLPLHTCLTDEEQEYVIERCV